MGVLKTGPEILLKKNKREQEYSRFFYPNKTLNQQKFSIQPQLVIGFRKWSPQLTHLIWIVKRLYVYLIYQ